MLKIVLALSLLILSACSTNNVATCQKPTDAKPVTNMRPDPEPSKLKKLDDPKEQAKAVLLVNAANRELYNNCRVDKAVLVDWINRR